MSVFGNIMSSILGGATATSSASAVPPAGARPSAAASSAPAGPPAGASPGAAAKAAPAPASTPPASSTTAKAAPAAPTPVDVAAVMDKLAAASSEDLDWRKSIVDLMKLLKLDSSLTTRRQLAKELKFSGNMQDSAAMNIWLHKEVMVKLAENGGKVPPELKH
ncbi:MAG TPA: DUF3597 domain-containing protein [Hyphomicrobiaceae bacterium]|nr:DUF3597 domain-containing protein [Hyphomicrobiaceae bacterium]